jgi:hypothetical protein
MQFPENRSSLTITEWCARHDISRRQFNLLEQQGRAPRTFNAGKKSRRISADADAAWIIEREAEAA